MWLKCCQCGQRFEVHGELEEKLRAFYAMFRDHTPDKEVGVCDSCWEEARSASRWTRLRRRLRYWRLDCWQWLGFGRH